MNLTRRNALTGLAVTSASLVLPGRANANLATENWSALRPLLARHWQGYAQTRTANTEGGELTLKLQVDLTPSDDMRFSGRLAMTSRWDTGTYSAVQAIRGYCWGTDDAVGVQIESSSLVSGDSLPDNLYWQGLTGQLRLYSERGNEGHWLLSGNLAGTRDGNSFETQLSDHS